MLLGVLLLAGALGLLKRWYDGRFRPASQPDPRAARSPSVAGVSNSSDATAVRLGPDDLGGAGLGDRATLVQFSSAFCAPCRATRQVLGEVAGVVPGVAHVEIDAESHLELVRRLDVRRTPTTLVLDADGRVTTRASGQPRKEQVIAALPL